MDVHIDDLDGELAVLNPNGALGGAQAARKVLETYERHRLALPTARPLACARIYYYVANAYSVLQNFDRAFVLYTEALSSCSQAPASFGR